MDATERLVLNHLKHRGYVDIKYEPDGNIPPDFLVNEQVAIEVRRLNQNYFDGNETKGLEEVAIPLWRRIEKLITSFGAPTECESWFIFFRFSRPVEPWKSIEASARQAIESFKSAQTKQKGIIFKIKGFEIDVFKASKPHENMFIMGGCSDDESGGWILAEMEKNIIHCASEKSRKIKKFRSKYDQWWLALVDHIGQGLDDYDTDMFRSQVSISHDWDKIIIIDPNDPSRYIEI